MKRFIQAIVTLSILVSISIVWSNHAVIAASTLDTTQNYKIVNQNSGLLLGISGASKTAGAAALQWTDNGNADHLWHFIPDGSNNYKIESVNSGEILGISGASTSAGTVALQWADNGTDDHLWQFDAAGSGTYNIVNQNSGLLLAVSGASKTAGAAVIQWGSDGGAEQRWTLVAAGTAYANPSTISGDTLVRDPSMIKASNGTYYVYSTSTGTSAPYDGIEMRSSTDRVHFSNAGTAFTTLPSWVKNYDGGNGDVWAPDISYRNGKYWLYFAVSTFGSQNSAIGLATSNTAAPGSWTDQGIVLTSSTGGAYNAIDPCLVIDASGNTWLSFGSWWTGIYMIQIDPATGKQLSSNTTFYHLAERLITSKGLEASYVYAHGGYYYLFASLDQCCDANATYHIIVGRSTSITGPYIDQGGLNMLNGGGTIILSTHGNIVGPGGASVMTDAGSTLIDYQYHDANNGGNPALGINLIGWNAAGWPYVH